MIKYVYGLEKEDPLFVSKRGKRITSRQVENVIKQLRQDSEIDVAMTPHTLDIGNCRCKLELTLILSY